ncbi:sensor histidine kinase [Serratia marcescens]|uniref:sensor histidine kinase n=1 Tax=Serratia marcescens TaxID=615 RepID=UPI002ED2ABB6|nr:sensor histidine kinase [Serratia marcescens]
MNNENELKKQLLKTITVSKDGTLLINENIDYDRLIELSEKISAFDKENVRFSVDAKLVERLGEQLVAKKTTALSELVKNAYDADATTAVVDFIGTEQPGGKINIQDSGNGMSFDELVNGFMKISTSDKSENPVSPKYSRPRAGKKGIGRFSAQKIGSSLKIITKKNNDNFYTCIEIDWEQYASGQSIHAIKNKVYYDYDSAYTFQHGTRLEISNVKEAWTDSNISTAFNYLSNIIVVRPSKNKTDPGFDVKFKFIDSSGNLKDFILDDNSAYFSSADVKVLAEMKEGYCLVKIEGINNPNLSDELEIKELYHEDLLECKYRLELHYFGLSQGDARVKYLNNFLRLNGGIRLYRNDFHVAPYGERFNDWLSLDESSRRRIILPPHSNTNFVGGVYVYDPAGDKFEETSSREGVLETDNFKNLVEVTKNIALKVASNVASEKGKKVTASQKYEKNKPLKEKVSEQLENLKSKIVQKNALNTSYQNEDHPTKISQASDESLKLDSEIEQGIISFDNTFKEFINEQLMYRVLSSMGLAISEFTHEIQTYLTNLRLNSVSLLKLSEENSDLVDIQSELETNLSMLVAYTDFFDGTMRSNSNREKNNYEIRHVINKFFKAMSPTIQRRGYVLESKFDSWDIWTKRLHISELMSILINLFTNSIKAIQRANPDKGKILIDVKTSETDITIRFEDNGDGIPKNKWAEVFRPLFTTEVPATSYASENQYMRGMGLGLSITEQIIIELDGEISVTTPSENYKTCIKIVLPRAKETEIPEDAY